MYKQVKTSKQHVLINDVVVDLGAQGVSEDVAVYSNSFIWVWVYCVKQKARKSIKI